MIEKLKQELYNYFDTKEILLKEISAWRSNTNYFITVWNKQYFLRTSITKISDSIFWGQLEKENKIYQQLKWKWVTADIINYYDNGSDFQFLITEKIEWEMPTFFNENQQSIKELINKLQSIDYTNFDFLETFHFEKGFKNIIKQRFDRVNIQEPKNILSQLMNYLYNNKWSITEELVLCHNDFRSDNIISSNNGSKIIDLEWLVISDKYIDIAEYFIWWVFWNNFIDLKEFDYEIYQNYMNKFWYIDKEKQKYIFIMKFCSNYSWLASHLSETQNPLEIYTQALERNTNKYYKSIKWLLV